MDGQLLKIVFLKDKAYLTADKHFTFEQLVGLPSMVRSFESLAYWEIKVLNHNIAQKKLYVDVLSYHIGEIYFSDKQVELAEKLNLIEIITFKNINTIGLLRTMRGDKPANYSPQKLPVANDIPKVNRPISFTIRNTFSVPIKDVLFHDGFVSFVRKFNNITKPIEITIQNEDIRVEYDAVKNYFANILKVKKIQVFVEAEITDNSIKILKSKSPEIAKINTSLIENVKFEFVKATFKKVLPKDTETNLFTMDEYFEHFTEEKKKETPFYTSDKELLEDVLKITNTKHYKHLRFLSSKHSHSIMKLRFVHKPLSFIFLITGDKNFHIIWETLNTKEATYIWHIDKNIQLLKTTLQKISNVIGEIRVNGKNAYLNSTNEPFRRIYHDYSEQVDGFQKWKNELDSFLT
jgi:hypothetical protein